MSEYRVHLNERIEQLKKAHQEYQKREAEATDKDMKLAYNSLAASTFDMLCEVENLLKLYNVCHQEKDELDIVY